MARPAQIFERLILKLRSRKKRFIYLILVLGLGLTYAVVYLTGGTQNPYLHLMYIWIAYAGVFLGLRQGIAVGLIAGILVGPLMPFSTDPLVFQHVFPWIFRMAVFVGCGWFTGASTDSLRRNFDIIRLMFSRDQETGLPNINSLSEYRAADGTGKKILVLTVLVTNHETVTDLLGRDVYTHLFHKLFDRLRKGLRADSTLVQAGSDKAWITMPSEDFVLDIQKVLALLEEPFMIADVPVFVGFAIGAGEIANPEECRNFAAYHTSDWAARVAQKTKVPFVVYNEKVAGKRTEIELLSTFLRALEDNQTYLMYQPVIDLKTGKPASLEALIRWTHPTHGMIMPDLFIPLIEGTALVKDLTDWVLKRALDQIKSLDKNGIALPVSINVSGKNLLEAGFFDRMADLTAQAGVLPGRVEFELTESSIIANLEDNRKRLNDVMEKGFSVALDDFGKGYTSFAYLSRFQVKVVKLDQFFMHRIKDEPKVRQVVQGAIELAHQLGSLVVAEGIEDETVAGICRDMGCDFGQGYHFARPMIGNDLIPWLKEHLK